MLNNVFSGNRINQFLLFCACLVISLTFGYFFQFNGLYGQDSFKYFFYGLNIGSENADYFAWPVNYPLLGFLFYNIFQSATLSFQLVSVLAFSLTGVILYKWIKRDQKGMDTHILIYLGLVYCLSPYLLRFSLSVMSDSLCALFLLVALYFASSKLNSYRVLSFLFTGFCIGTRYASFVLLLLPICLLIYEEFKAKRYSSIVIGTFLVVLGIIPTLILKHDPSNGLAKNALLESWSILNLFRNELSVSSQQAYSVDLPNAIFYALNYVHPRYFFIGIPLLLLSFFIFKNPGIELKSSIYLWSLVIYVFFISGLPFQNARFLLPTIPIFLYLISPIVIRISIALKRTISISLISVVLVAQVVLCALSFHPLVERIALEKEVTNGLNTFTVGNTPVYTSGMDGPMKYYCEDKIILPLHNEKLEIPTGIYVMVIDSLYIALNRENSSLSKNVNTLLSQSKLLRSKKIANWTIYELKK